MIISLIKPKNFATLTELCQLVPVADSKLVLIVPKKARQYFNTTAY